MVELACILKKILRYLIENIPRKFALISHKTAKLVTSSEDARPASSYAMRNLVQCCVIRALLHNLMKFMETLLMCEFSNVDDADFDNNENIQL